MDEREQNLLAKRAALELQRLRERVRILESEQAEPIAVLSTACRLPGHANSPEALWQLLAAGRDAVTEIPPERWDADRYYDPDPGAAGKMTTRHGGFLDGADLFDPKLFGITPAEAEVMDPQHRLLLEACWETLERGGYSPRGMSEREVGVFMGVMTEDYWLLLDRAFATGDLPLWAATGNGHSILSGRVAYSFGLQGPTFTVETACSSALVALHLACESLRNRECSWALAGGVHLLLDPKLHIVMSRTRNFSSSGRCLTFDAGGDGMSSSEGCAVVLLRRLSDALADRDPVQAVLRGSAINHNGPSSQLTAPNGRAQQKLLRRALHRSGLSPEGLHYLEAHGVGTALGDTIEMRAVSSVFAEPRPGRLAVGSSKTNLGHPGPVAGLAGLIKVVESMAHETIPSHLHLRRINPLIELSEAPYVVTGASTPWPRGASSPRRASVSSFGLSGTNACVVVEEAPTLHEPSNPPDRSFHLLPIAARTATSLDQLAASYADHLASQDPAAWPDTCYTAGVGRAHLERRMAVVAASADEASQILRARQTGERPAGLCQSGEGPPLLQEGVVFLFTGQGSNYTGMGQRLYQASSTFRAALDRCATILQGRLEVGLLELLFDEQHATQLGQRTGQALPALLSIQHATVELWRSLGVHPAAVIGHSAGEYAAALCAGVVSLEDALLLALERGRLIDGLTTPGEMLVIPQPEGPVREAIAPFAGTISVASLSAPDYTIVAGERDSVLRLFEQLRAAGVLVRQLGYTAGGHSPLMDPILEPFGQLADKVRFSPPALPLVSNLTGRLVESDEAPSSTYWKRHMRETVRFADGIALLHQQGKRAFVEIGPNPTLLGLTGLCLPGPDKLLLPSLRKVRDDWQQLLESAGQLYVHGAEIDWTGLDRDHPRARLRLPTYPFERSRYWTVPGSASERTPPAEPPSRLNEAFYQVSWRERDPAPETRPSVWLILADRGGVGSELARRLTTWKLPAEVIEQPADPTRAATLVEAALARRPAEAIVYLWGLDPAPGQEPELPGKIEEQARRLLGVMRAISAARAGRLWLVTRGAQPAGDVSRPLALEQAALWALGSVIDVEHHASWGGAIDLQPELGSGAAAEQLLWAVMSAGAERRIALRDGKQRVPRLARLTAESAAPIRFRSDASYLVMGGLGGIGLEVARWMTRRGARHLVLAGRRAPAETAMQVIGQLQADGVEVRAMQADASRASDLQGLLASMAEQMPPLRGVFHLAGVWDQQRLAALDWDRFRAELGPKVSGSWALHRLTGGLELDWFVLFSSQAALLPASGGAGYVVGNAFLDSLAHHRRGLGLPALSINWGGWREVGFVKDPRLQELLRSWHSAGIDSEGALSNQEGLAALELAMSQGPAQLAVLTADWSKLRQFGGYGGGFLDEILRELPPAAPAAAASAAAPAPVSGGLLDRYRSASPEERDRLILDYLGQQIGAALGRQPSELPLDEPLPTLGLDSLRYVELANKLKAELGVDLPVAKLIEGRLDIQLLSGLVADLLQDQTAGPASGPASREAALALAVLAKLDADVLMDNVDRFSEEELDLIIRVVSAGPG